MIGRPFCGLGSFQVMRTHNKCVAVGAAAPYFYNGRRGKYAEQLEILAKSAKNKPRGLWKACSRTAYDPYSAIETRR